MAFVLDASIAIAWVVHSKASPYAKRIRLRARHEPFHVPCIFIAEVANVLVVLERRGILTGASADAAADVERGAANFDLGVQVRVPSGATARAQANLAAIRLVRDLEAEQRPATDDEQQILARWSGWGAVPQILDRSNDAFGELRDQLRELLADDEYRAAEASILNAHYTDPAVAAQMWSALVQAGFDGGRVL